MQHEEFARGSSSPTAAQASGAKPPPLTPYRGHALNPPGPQGMNANSGSAAAPGSRASAGFPGARSAAAVVMPAGGSVSATAGNRGGPPPPLWQQALEQEKRLRNELRKRSFWDPEVRRLRAALQGTYEAMVFQHFEFAAAHDAEQCLWKAVFYKPIEEFRSRVRALEVLAKGSAGGALYQRARGIGFSRAL